MQIFLQKDWKKYILNTHMHIFRVRDISNVEVIDTYQPLLRIGNCNKPVNVRNVIKTISSVSFKGRPGIAYKITFDRAKLGRYYIMRIKNILGIRFDMKSDILYKSSDGSEVSLFISGDITHGSYIENELYYRLVNEKDISEYHINTEYRDTSISLSKEVKVFRFNKPITAAMIFSFLFIITKNDCKDIGNAKIICNTITVQLNKEENMYYIKLLQYDNGSYEVVYNTIL